MNSHKLFLIALSCSVFAIAANTSTQNELKKSLTSSAETQAQPFAEDKQLNNNVKKEEQKKQQDITPKMHPMRSALKENDHEKFKALIREKRDFDAAIKEAVHDKDFDDVEKLMKYKEACEAWQANVENCGLISAKNQKWAFMGFGALTTGCVWALTKFFEIKKRN